MINLIDNTTTHPHITVNRDRISDIGGTIHCYHTDTTMDNDCPAAVLHAVQPDGS